MADEGKLPTLAVRSRFETNSALAYAKVNLTLEIKGRRDDGYHELESLVAFADFGDQLVCRSAEGISLTCEGPFAATLDSGGNLVEKAAAAYAEAFGEEGAAFHLIKRLPVAAGLGGGSADAAAVLRLLRNANGVPRDILSLVPLARRIGADVPCCLISHATIMTGIGEQLHPLSPFPPIPAVLVNPMQPLATRDVFRKLNARSPANTTDRLTLPVFETLGDLFTYAQARRNDLEAPARALLPVIGEILASLSALPGVRLARLSGSGPTCFALFENPLDAQNAANQILDGHPGWWVQPVTLR